jgi:hypothetical protein
VGGSNIYSIQPEGIDNAHFNQTWRRCGYEYNHGDQYDPLDWGLLRPFACPSLAAMKRLPIRLLGWLLSYLLPKDVEKGI